MSFLWTLNVVNVYIYESICYNEEKIES